METEFNFLGIPGAPEAVRSVLKGSIYAAVLDSIPAHASLMVQTLKSNLSAGTPCVLTTKMPPGEFLRMAQISGVDFRDDIACNRLFLFSREGDFMANIFRRGINRFLDEFEYFQVPKGSFFLFDHAWDLFTRGEQDVAQTQAIDYRTWMESSGNTSLFIFPGKNEHVPQGILRCFDGIARIIQSKTAIELLIDYWYSERGALAAKAYPISFESSGLIRIDASGKRGFDANVPAPPRYVALTPTMPRPLRGEAARYRLLKWDRRFQRQSGAADATRGDRWDQSHHRRDDT